MATPPRASLLALAAHATLAALLTAPAAARAQARPSARLGYQRGAGAERCPDEQVLRDAVAARLGYDPFRPDASIAVAVRLARVGGALHAEVGIADAEGHPTGARRLSAEVDHCDELVAAVSLAVSIAIDPLGRARATPDASPVAPAPPDARTTPAPIRSEVVAAPAPAPSPRASAARPRAHRNTPARADALAFTAGVGGQFIAFAAPGGVSVGFLAHVGVRWRWWSASLEGRFDLPSWRRDDALGGFATHVLGATLVPCVRHAAVMGCALVTAGALRSLADAPNAAQLSPYIAAGARVALEFPLTWVLSVRLHADALAVLTTTGLFVAGAERDAWRTPWGTLALGAGVVATLP